MSPSHTYGFVLESTPTYVTRAIVHADGYVQVETLRPTDTVTLRLDAVRAIRALLATGEAEDPVLAELARLEAQTGCAHEDAVVQRFVAQDVV